MANWTPFNLTSSWGRPALERLTALRLAPLGDSSRVEYDIGRLRRDPKDPKSRKLWWHGTHGVQDPVRMKKHYDIWWCSVQEFDEPNKRQEARV